MANDDGSNKPQSLFDFRNARSLQSSRLNDGTWRDVDEIVKVDNNEGRPRTTVPGLLHGPNYRLPIVLRRDVEPEIVADASSHHELLNQKRALIVQWKVFPQLARKLRNYEPD